MSGSKVESRSLSYIYCWGWHISGDEIRDAGHHQEARDDCLCVFVLASFRDADVTAMPPFPPVSKLLVSHNTQPPLPQTGCKAQSITPTYKNFSPQPLCFLEALIHPSPSLPVLIHHSLPCIAPVLAPIQYTQTTQAFSSSTSVPCCTNSTTSIHLPASVSHRSYPAAASGLNPCYISAACQLCWCLPGSCWSWPILPIAWLRRVSCFLVHKNFCLFKHLGWLNAHR